MSSRVYVSVIACLCVGVASAVAFALSAAEERVPESLLPADAVVYFGWDGTEKHQADWEKTAAYESLDKTHFLRTLEELALSYIPGDAPINARTVRELLDGLARKGFSLAVSVPKDRPIPQVMLVLHHAAMLDHEFTTRLPRMLSDGVKFETQMVRGRSITRGTISSIKDAEIAWWAEGGHLVIVFGQHAVDAALDVADGKAPALPTSAAWHKYREEPKDFPTIAAAWCDVAALKSRFGPFVIVEKSEKAPELTVGKLIDILGGGRLGHVVLRCGIKDRAIVYDSTIDAPTPRTGLLALADQKPITLADLPPLPKDETGFFVASFNWSHAYDVLLKMAREIGDAVSNNGSAQVDQALDSLPQLLGFELKNDLLDALGNVVCVYGDASAGIPGGFGFGVALSVKDPDTLRKTLKTVAKRVQGMLPNGMTIAEEERSSRPTWIFDLGQVPVHPAVCLDKKWLFVGLSPQSVETALLRIDGKLDTWKPSDAEKAALDTVPKQFVALTLTDPRPIYSAVATYLPILVTAFNAAAPGPRGNAPDRAAGKRMSLLADMPPVEVLTRSMFPNVSTLTVDEKGLRSQARESAPGIAGGGVAIAPIAVALLLPAVQASREAARRAQSTNNLKQIALAMHNYHDVYGRFPEGTRPNAELKPDKRLSWQTSILPFIDQSALYNQLDLKKSWDDPANKKVVMSPIVTLMNPSLGEQKRDGFPVTEYVGMAGVGADAPMLPVNNPKAGVFGYDRVTRIRDITDGTSNTIMTSECNKELGSWAAGGRPTIRSLTKQPYIDGPDGLGGNHAGGCVMGLADGSVRFVSSTIDPKVLEALMTIAGGETVGGF